MLEHSLIAALAWRDAQGSVCFIPYKLDFREFTLLIVVGQDIQRLCPIDIMPVFIKAGTILPFGPEVQNYTALQDRMAEWYQP